MGDDGVVRASREQNKNRVGAAPCFFLLFLSMRRVRLRSSGPDCRRWLNAASSHRRPWSFNCYSPQFPMGTLFLHVLPASLCIQPVNDIYGWSLERDVVMITQTWHKQPSDSEKYGWELSEDCSVKRVTSTRELMRNRAEKSQLLNRLCWYTCECVDLNSLNPLLLIEWPRIWV